MLNTLSFDNPITFVLIAGVLVWAIARQVQARQLNSRSLVVIPAVCAYFAFQQGPVLAHLDALSWGFLAVSAAVGAAAGFARGFTIRTWLGGDGSWWTQGTWLTLAIWGAMIAFRIVASVIAHFAGVATTAMTAEILVMVGITFGAQNLVVWLRTMQPVAVP